MKKIFLTAALVCTAGLGMVFSQSAKSNDSYLPVTFKEHFAEANVVNLKKVKNYTEITFTINHEQLSVFYNADNRPFATSRNILSTQLPLALSDNLKRNYKNYWITGLMELAIDGHSAYYVTLENAAGKKIMKSDDFGQWMAFRPEVMANW